MNEAEAVVELPEAILPKGWRDAVLPAEGALSTELSTFAVRLAMSDGVGSLSPDLRLDRISHSKTAQDQVSESLVLAAQAPNEILQLLACKRLYGSTAKPVWPSLVTTAVREARRRGEIWNPLLDALSDPSKFWDLRQGWTTYRGSRFYTGREETWNAATDSSGTARGGAVNVLPQGLIGLDEYLDPFIAQVTTQGESVARAVVGRFCSEHLHRQVAATLDFSGINPDTPDGEEILRWWWNRSLATRAGLGGNPLLPRQWEHQLLRESLSISLGLPLVEGTTWAKAGEEERALSGETIGRVRQRTDLPTEDRNRLAKAILAKTSQTRSSGSHSDGSSTDYHLARRRKDELKRLIKNPEVLLGTLQEVIMADESMERTTRVEAFLHVSVTNEQREQWLKEWPRPAVTRMRTALVYEESAVPWSWIAPLTEEKNPTDQIWSQFLRHPNVSEEVIRRSLDSGSRDLREAVSGNLKAMQLPWVRAQLISSKSYPILLGLLRGATDGAQFGALFFRVYQQNPLEALQALQTTAVPEGTKLPMGWIRSSLTSKTLEEREAAIRAMGRGFFEGGEAAKVVQTKAPILRKKPRLL